MANKIGPKGLMYIGKICQEFGGQCKPNEDVMPILKSIISNAEKFENPDSALKKAYFVVNCKNERKFVENNEETEPYELLKDVDHVLEFIFAKNTRPIIEG